MTRVENSLPISLEIITAGRVFAIYGKLPSYRAMLDREGFAGPEDAALIGDENTVSEHLDVIREAGVDEFVAIPFDPSPEGAQRTRACLRACPG